MGGSEQATTMSRTGDLLLVLVLPNGIRPVLLSQHEETNGYHRFACTFVEMIFRTDPTSQYKKRVHPVHIGLLSLSVDLFCGDSVFAVEDYLLWFSSVRSGRLAVLSLLCCLPGGAEEMNINERRWVLDDGLVSDRKLARNYSVASELADPCKVIETY